MVSRRASKAAVPFNHVGLPVRDERRSQHFYSAYFGFDQATAPQYPNGTVIIRNAEGFDLRCPAASFSAVLFAERTVAPVPGRSLCLLTWGINSCHPGLRRNHRARGVEGERST